MKCTNNACCREMAHTAEVKLCRVCRKEISWREDGFGGCLMCNRCSKTLKLCGHCLTPLSR